MSRELSIKKIRFEINEIDSLLDNYSILLSLVKTKEPDLIEMTAMATVLHSFYGGIEKIFTIIAKDIDESLPSGIKWHKDILVQMNKQNHSRQPVISADTFGILNDYLGFRHFYRHSYSFQLSWDKLENLCVKVDEVWGTVKREIEDFLERT